MLAADHRRPPDPPFYMTPGRVCHVCAAPLPKIKRRYCSEACSNVMDFVWQPRWHAYMLARDTFGDQMARCFECGRTAREVAEAMGTNVAWSPLALDHIRPLWSLSATERLELKWWLPFNTQLLCRECHAKKTAREAGQRAMEKRIAANVELFRTTGVLTDTEIVEWVAKARASVA